MQCFAEYAGIANQEQTSPISRQLLGQATPESRELYDFAVDPLADLHDYPLAFIEVKELAFANCDDRSIERVHVQVKNKAKGGFRYRAPSGVSARLRLDQTWNIISNNTFAMDFIVRNWWRRGMFNELLEHLIPPQDLRPMSAPAKFARIYQYSEADHFDDAAELDGALELFEEAHKRVRAQMQYPLTRNGAAMLEFISGMFTHNVVYSLPQPLMTKLLRDQVTCTFAPDDASVLLALQPGEAANLNIAQLYFSTSLGIRRTRSIS